MYVTRESLQSRSRLCFLFQSGPISEAECRTLSNALKKSSRTFFFESSDIDLLQHIQCTLGWFSACGTHVGVDKYGMVVAYPWDCCAAVDKLWSIGEGKVKYIVASSREVNNLCEA